VIGQRRRGLPPVGGKEQVNGAIVEVLRGLQVVVNDGTRGGGAVGKAHGGRRASGGEEAIQQEAALRCFAAPIDAFQKDKSAAVVGRRLCGNHGGGRVGVDENLCTVFYLE